MRAFRPRSTRERPPKNWTQIDRDYEPIRLAMQTLFIDVGSSLNTAATQTTSCRSPFSELSREGYGPPTKVRDWFHRQGAGIRW
jgi:hypothetical protein